MSHTVDSASLDGSADDSHLQRMATIGTLVLGMGHELRNLVMPILLRLDVLSAASDLSVAAREDIARIRDGVTGIQRLAAGLRWLGSDPMEQRSEARITVLHDWFRDVHPVLKDALPTHAMLQGMVPASLPQVAVPAGALAQVTITLVLHARRFTESIAEPRITLVCRREPERVCLDVADNGSPFDEVAEHRSFESVATWPAPWYGTGLGLAASRALMRRYGGDVTVSSARDGGARFTVHLPLAQGQSTTSGHEGRRVHLVVGDPRQRTLLRLLLTQRGLSEWQAGEDGSADVIVCDGDTVASLAGRRDPGASRLPRIIALGRAAVSDSQTDVCWAGTDDLPRLAALLADA